MNGVGHTKNTCCGRSYYLRPEADDAVALVSDSVNILSFLVIKRECVLVDGMPREEVDQ